MFQLIGHDNSFMAQTRRNESLRCLKGRRESWQEMRESERLSDWKARRNSFLLSPSVSNSRFQFSAVRCRFWLRFTLLFRLIFHPADGLHTKWVSVECTIRKFPPWKHSQQAQEVSACNLKLFMLARVLVGWETFDMHLENFTT